MKYKKYSYILILILMLMIGVNGVNAYSNPQEKMCYYMSNDGNFKTRIKLMWGYNNDDDWWQAIIPVWNIYYGISNAYKELDTASYADVTVDKIGENDYVYNDEFVANWVPDTYDNCIAGGSVCFETRYNSVHEANSSEPQCPKYAVFQSSTYYWVWTTDDFTKASTAEKNIRNYGYNGHYGSLTTSDEYFKEFIEEGILTYDSAGEVTCQDYEAIFGSKDDPDSIRYMVNTILQYVRIIVPILIILLGTIDFAKAVLAGKEDNMKKAQTDFIKRVMIGVAVFFVPLLVDVVMWLADIVWAGQYPHCPL